MTTSITSLRNPIDDLTSQLNQPPAKPPGTLEQEFGGMVQRGAKARELAPQIMQESLKQEQKVGKDIMQQRTQSAEDVGNLAKRQAASTKLLEEEAIAARPQPIEFAPTQQTPEQLQTIAISMMLVGALAGGGAKRSGIAGLKAMTGMLDGYKQGRKDVFDREKIIFEKALETQKQKIEEVKAMYESAVRAKLAGDQAEYNSLQARIQAETDNGTMQYAFATRNTDQIRKQLEAAEKGMSEGLKGMADLREAEENRKLRREELAARRGEFKTVGVDENGNVVQINEAGTTRTVSGVKPASASGSRFTQQQAIAQRAVNSLGGVASALESIRELPAGTTTGLLPNLQTKDGMFNYVRNTMGRKIAPRDAEMMNTLFTGIGRNLASIESSGIATGLVELSKQMQSGTYINSGVDDPYKVAIKLADIRRIATENIRPAIESGGMPKQQAETAMKLVERIEQAIPFDTIDVVRAANSKGRPTIGERTTQVVKGAVQMPTFATQEEAQAARDRGEITAGTAIRIGNQTGKWKD
jgi:hypothetical protein